MSPARVELEREAPRYTLACLADLVMGGCAPLAGQSQASARLDAAIGDVSCGSVRIRKGSLTERVHPLRRRR